MNSNGLVVTAAALDTCLRFRPAGEGYGPAFIEVQDEEEERTEEGVVDATEQQQRAAELDAALEAGSKSFTVPAGPLELTDLFDSDLVKHLQRALNSFDSYYTVFDTLERILEDMASVYCSEHFDTSMSRVAVLSVTISIMGVLPVFYTCEEVRRAPAEQLLLCVTSDHREYLHLFMVLALLDRTMEQSCVMVLPRKGSTARTLHLNCFLSPLAVTLTFEGKVIRNLGDAVAALGVRRMSGMPSDVHAYCRAVAQHCAQHVAAITAPAA